MAQHLCPTSECQASHPTHEVKTGFDNSICEAINRKAGMAFWPVSLLTGNTVDSGLYVRSLRDPAFFIMMNRAKWRWAQQWYWRLRWQIQNRRRWWRQS